MFIPLFDRSTIVVQPTLVAARRSNGAAFLDGTFVPLAMKNFPRNRGVVAGVLKSTFGLSASILTTVYTGFFSPHTTPFLLFLGLFICTVALLSLWCVQRRGGGLLHRAAVLLAALAHA
jgi:Nodulin-like